MPDLTPDQDQQISSELLAGRKIQAIKLYRKFTNTDLKDAKDAVESIESALRQIDPTRIPEPKGCSTRATIFLILISALAVVVFRI